MDIKEELENVTGELKSLSNRCEEPIISVDIIRSKSATRKMIKLEMINPEELKTKYVLRKIHHRKKYIQKSVQEYYEKRNGLPTKSS